MIEQNHLPGAAQREQEPIGYIRDWLDPSVCPDFYRTKPTVEIPDTAIIAVYAAQPPAALVETPTIDDVPSCGQENDYRRAQPDQGSMHELAREQTYSSIKTCRECGVSDPCGEDCPNYIEPKDHPRSSAATEGETKTVYVKRWRTLVKLPAKYADEIVAALRIPDVVTLLFECADAESDPEFKRLLTEAANTIGAQAMRLDACEVEIEKLRDRCEAYKGQVQAGAAEIKRLTQPQEAPDGFVLVPREPSNEILKAGCVALDKPAAKEEMLAAMVAPGQKGIAIARTKMRLRWKAMIEAASTLSRPMLGGEHG